MELNESKGAGEMVGRLGRGDGSQMRTDGMEARVVSSFTLVWVQTGDPRGCAQCSV